MNARAHVLAFPSHRAGVQLPVQRLLICQALLIGLVVLSGCSSSGTLSRDTSARAELDNASVQVLYPVDEYRMSPYEQAKVSRANALVMAACMEKMGYPFEVSESETPMEFRPYGLWNVERAAKYGYDMPAGGNITEDTSGMDERPGGPRDQSRVKCLGESQSQMAQFKPVGEPDNPALTERIQSEARSAAEAEPDWGAARELWYECIEDAGLSRHSNGESWLSQQGFDVLAQQSVPPTPAQKQEEIRIAVIEARCNESTSLTQTLANIEASFQAPLIQENRAALIEEKRQNQQALARASEYIRAQS